MSQVCSHICWYKRAQYQGLYFKADACLLASVKKDIQIAYQHRTISQQCRFTGWKLERKSPCSAPDKGLSKYFIITNKVSENHVLLLHKTTTINSSGINKGKIVSAGY
jgi:hypothetical protein